jgi:hypothetical protein
MPLPRLPPGSLYFLNLIFYTSPQERPRLLGIGMTGIAIDFKVIQLHPL